MPKLGEVNLHSNPPTMAADRGEWVPLGSLQSRKKYPELFAVIGYAYCDEDKRCCNSELFVCGPDYDPYQTKPQNERGAS